MAGITGTIQDWTSGTEIAFAITKVVIVDGETAAGPLGVIQPFGVIPTRTPGSSGTPVNRFAKSNAHAIDGYRSLLGGGFRGTFNDRFNTAQTNQTILIEEYATDAGDLDGVEVNGSDTDWVVSAKRSGTTEDAAIEIRFYHRTSGGTETLLATAETTNLTTSFVTYTGMVNFTQSFGMNELLVVKFYIHNKGVAP